MKVVRALRERDVPVLLTAVYDRSQALIASALDVQWIAPYVNRMLVAQRAAFDEVAAMVRILDAEGSGPRVLAASIKSVDQVSGLAEVGVRAFALAPQVAAELLADPLTLAAVDEFEDAMASVL